MYQRLSGDAARQYLDLTQVWEAWTDVRQVLASRFAGGMRWREIHGRRYLYRVLDSRTEKCLGPESPENERLYAEFQAQKAERMQHERMLKHRIEDLARIARALRLGQCTHTAGKLLRRLHDTVAEHDKAFLVVGTHALYAYEALAGVRIDPGLRTTSDLDLLWDGKQRIKLVSSLPENGLLGLIQKVDRSFAVLSKAPFRAVNQEGFMVDFLCAPQKIRDHTAPTLGSSFVPAEANGQEWLRIPRKSATQSTGIRPLEAERRRGGGCLLRLGLLRQFWLELT